MNFKDFYFRLSIEMLNWRLEWFSTTLSSAIDKDFSQLQNGLAIISYWKLVGSVVILKTETIVLIDGSLDAGVVHNFWREREIGSKAAAFNYVDTSLSFVDITIQKKKNQTTVSFDNSDYFQNIAT